MTSDRRPLSRGRLFIGRRGSDSSRRWSFRRLMDILIVYSFEPDFVSEVIMTTGVILTLAGVLIVIGFCMLGYMAHRHG